MYSVLWRSTIFNLQELPGAHHIGVKGKAESQSAGVREETGG